MLVVDASVAVAASYRAGGFEELGGEQLVAPALMWSEARSTPHELLWRREITVDDDDATRKRLEGCPIEQRAHPRLGAEAWSIAGQLAWAKTYDAEYVALARLSTAGSSPSTLAFAARRSASASSSHRASSDAVAARALRAIYASRTGL